MKNVFAEIRCNGITKKSRPCTSYLGHVQVDVDNTAYFHCQQCNRTKGVKVKSGVVSILKVDPKDRIFSPEPVTVLIRGIA